MNDPIQDKAPKPTGLFPKHVQSWVILGLAVLMVVIMWLTSGKKQQSTAKGSAPVPQPPLAVEVNETKIAELQNRIQELQRQQLVAQSALAQQSRLFANIPADQPAPSGSASSNSLCERTEDPIKAERKKREYLSLFASNIALTYRKTRGQTQTEQTGAANPPAEQAVVDPTVPPTEAALVAQMLRDSQIAASKPTPTPSGSDAAQVHGAPGNTAEASRQEKEANNPAAAQMPAAAAGKTYTLFEGTILESVLLNRLDGQFVGPVECLLTNDVFSHDRQHLLIAAGSKILGEAKKVDAFGQTRLAVVFSPPRHARRLLGKSRPIQRTQSGR